MRGAVLVRLLRTRMAKTAATRARPREISHPLVARREVVEIAAEDRASAAPIECAPKISPIESPMMRMPTCEAIRLAIGASVAKLRMPKAIVKTKSSVRLPWC